MAVAKKKKTTLSTVRESKPIWIVLIILCVIAILPLFMVVSASLTDNQYIVLNGYSLFPVQPTLWTYEFLMDNRGAMLVKAFGLTFAVAVCGTIYSLIVQTLFAYAVTQKKEVFRFSRVLSFFAWFTSIFGGGVLPWYILCTQYYGLKNNFWALFIPYGMSVWNMFILRGGFRGVPVELIEAAKLDGASHFKTFYMVSVPLARSSIVTIALFQVLGFWNDFHLPQWLIQKNSMYTLQKLLYNMLSNSLALLRDSELSNVMEKIEIPTETAKMAVAVMAIIPILMLYPFGLKYFVKGINMGGVKG